MALTLNVTASYYNHKGIPPRCRKEQPTYFTVRASFDLAQAPAESFTLAATVHSSQYFTSDAVEGFYTPVADVADVERLDLSTGGIFKDTKDTQSLAAETIGLAQTLFDITPSRVSDTKVADSTLRQQVKDTFEDRLFTLPQGAAIDQQAGGEPTDANAQAYLAERAGQLVVAGATIFRRVPEPRLLVEVEDRSDKYLSAWNSPEHLRSRLDVNEIHPTLSIYTQNTPAYNAPAQAYDYQLRPLTDIVPTVEQLTQELLTLGPDISRNSTIDKLTQTAANLGVTVYKPDVFTPAPVFPSRQVRLSRLRAGVILDCLRASYGGVADYLSSYDRRSPIPGEVISSLLTEQEELTDKLAALGEPLFLPAERVVKLR